MSGNVLLPTEIITYANLGGASYAQSLAPLGYEIIEPRINPDNGFSATAFRNIETGEIVISYRGTDDFKDMTQADIDLALQKAPDQFNDALGFYNDLTKQFPNANIILTGHSLGGALAQLVGAANRNSIVYAYNAPGVDAIRSQISDLMLDANIPASEFTNINNFNMAFDPVSTRGVQLGNVTNYSPNTLDGLNKN